MAAITAVFLLTNGIGEATVRLSLYPTRLRSLAYANQPPKSSWTDFVIVSSIAAIASLVSTIVFLRHSSQSYTHQLLRSLESLREELSASVESTFRPSRTTEHPSLLGSDASIFDLTSQLHRSYVQAFFEPRFSRLHVQELHSFMGIIQRIRTELSCKLCPASLGESGSQYDCDQGVKPFRLVFAPTQPRNPKYMSLSMVLQRQLRTKFMPLLFLLSV